MHQEFTGKTKVLIQAHNQYRYFWNDSKIIITGDEKWFWLLFLVTLFLWILSDFSFGCYAMSIYLILDSIVCQS